VPTDKSTGNPSQLGQVRAYVGRITATFWAMLSRIKIKHVVGGILVYGVGAVAGASLLARKDDEEERVGKEGKCAFDGLASTFDDKIGTSEKWGGIIDYRKNLLVDCKGKTLEVAAGTARNLEYYPEEAQLTLLDVSENMLVVAKEKKAKLGKEATLVCGTCTELPFDDCSFDNVVDTFGLCSFDNPEVALSEMKRVCKKGGRIRLLEHGRSHYNIPPLDWFLDARAPHHADRWGCWWNRDIDNFVNSLDDIIVESQNYHHLGTTYELVLKRT